MTLDDSFKARNHILYGPDLLQLPRNGMFCWCGEFSGKMESRPMCVRVLPFCHASLTFGATLTAGLTGFAVFVSVIGIVMSSIMLAVPVIYEKYDKFNRLARVMRELRVAFILAGASTSVALLISCVSFHRSG